MHRNFTGHNDFKSTYVVICCTIDTVYLVTKQFPEKIKLDLKKSFLEIFENDILTLNLSLLTGA